MRLFVAVALEDAVRAAAAKTAGALRGACARSGIDARWVATENLHLTVRFIGHVADERVEPLIAAVTAPIDIAPFVLALSGCGAFPSSGAPRVIWIGVSEGLDGLRAIHDEMDRRLLPFGFEPEARAFSAHLTLARVKDAPRGAGRALRERLQARVVTLPPARVTAATLFRSHPSPRGARYEGLAAIPLR